MALSAPYFSHCLIAHSSSSGIYCDQKTFLIDSSAVKYCNDYGINITSVAYTTVDFNLHADTIANNSEGGLYFDKYFTLQSVSIKNCSFINNQGSGALQIIPSFDNAIISDNYFYNNNSSNDSYGATAFFQGNKKFVIDCNRFINNQSGGKSTLGFANNISGQGNFIINNIFIGNTSSLGSPVIGMYSIPQSAVHNTYILNNYISNNTSPGNPCINIGSALTLVDTTFVDHYIENNTFINNDAPGMFEFGINANQQGSNNFIHLKRNNFLNPLCQYEINNTIPFGVSNIEADSNYWGTTSIQHVDSVIYDFFDLGNLSVVYNSPILSSAIVTDTTCPVIPTGIHNIETLHYNWIIYPIPANSFLTINLNNIVNKGFIELYNVLGKKVLAQNIFFTSKKEINLQNISSGIYLVKLFNGEKYYCKKIIVERD